VTDPTAGLAPCANGEAPLDWQTGALTHGDADGNQPVTLPAKTWVDLVSVSLALTATSDVWLSATVDAKGPLKGKAQLQLRVLEDGVPDADLTYATLAAGTYTSVPTGVIGCNGMPAAVHAWTLQAMASTDSTGVRSTLDAVRSRPARSGRAGLREHGLGRAEHELVALGVHLDRPLTQRALEQPHGQRVLEQPLDRAADRARSEGRVVALADDQLAGRVAHLQLDAPLREPGAQPLQLQLDDLSQLRA
jgi:hypothetical protein